MKQRRGIRSPRPRRVVIRASIFLLLGAIVNIAVAWGIRVMHDEFSLPVTRTELSAQLVGDLWRRNTPTAWHGAGQPNWYAFEIRQWGRFIVCAGGVEPKLRAGYEIERLSVGFPCSGLSLQYLERSESIGASGMESVSSITVTQDGLNLFGLLLPIGPEWPGFAINTLFYATILWLLFALPGALRRWRRIKRGLCPACAYPVGASDLCTECGKPIHSPLRGRARERMGHQFKYGAE